MTEGAIFGVSQAKVFEVLYKIVDLPFLANYKSQIDVSTFSITLLQTSVADIMFSCTAALWSLNAVVCVDIAG
jgi:hypothetical protein